MMIDKFILDCIKEFQRNSFWKEMPPAEKERLAEIIEFLGGSNDKEVRERNIVEPAIYQFKITLKGIRPPIWRRFLIHSEVTFKEFHNIIQVVMGWENCHLYNFYANDSYIEEQGDAINMFASSRAKYDAADIQIGEFITEEKQKCLYTYDFGDGWEHEIVLEKILPPDENTIVPRCKKGKRACPPEDCGGPYMYNEIQKALRGEGEIDEGLREWLGEFDSEEFDVDEVNEMLEE
ncbi:plasmid pRiA4b ORF-3 family protein [Bacillus cereus]|uniref:plasmid pRiA4b ORF-3 family protein n=1 Tax=Bacillus cereus group TaxID=86661 RepID=UPI001BA62706|nr:plasmid pRiA4b ORF-3 family protein [Bacillus cereus]MBR9656752.1 plasmid pRiA4b ORF-3 family protein [Bacillus cereus]MCU5440141.1 plasmid pRiA4b ORF-3 family protein [Bacillus cereus]